MHNTLSINESLSKSLSQQPASTPNSKTSILKSIFSTTMLNSNSNKNNCMLSKKMIRHQQLQQASYYQRTNSQTTPSQTQSNLSPTSVSSDSDCNNQKNKTPSTHKINPDDVRQDVEKIKKSNAQVLKDITRIDSLAINNKDLDKASCKKLAKGPIAKILEDEYRIPKGMIHEMMYGLTQTVHAFGCCIVMENTKEYHWVDNTNLQIIEHNDDGTPPYICIQDDGDGTGMHIQVNIDENDVSNIKKLRVSNFIRMCIRPSNSDNLSKDLTTKYYTEEVILQWEYDPETNECKIIQSDTNFSPLLDSRIDANKWLMSREPFNN